MLKWGMFKKIIILFTISLLVSSVAYLLIERKYEVSISVNIDDIFLSQSFIHEAPEFQNILISQRLGVPSHFTIEYNPRTKIYKFNTNNPDVKIEANNIFQEIYTNELNRLSKKQIRKLNPENLPEDLVRQLIQLEHINQVGVDLLSERLKLTFSDVRIKPSFLKLFALSLILVFSVFITFNLIARRPPF